MQKIWLIAWREYLTRVRKKSFIIMSILGPLLIVGFYGVVIWSAMNTKEDKTVLVIDDSGLMNGRFEDDGRLNFLYGTTSLTDAISDLGFSVYDAVLYIPKFDTLAPKGFEVYAMQSLAAGTEAHIRKSIEKEIEMIRLVKCWYYTQTAGRSKNYHQAGNQDSRRGWRE